jgi:2-deoxy-D-gluconate 3-dehydrogenase
MSVLDLFNLEGKTALVTGARRGLGRGMAVALAQAGADIIGVSKSLEPTGSDVARDVQAAGRAFHPYACDFRNRTALYAFIRQALAEHPVVDILVNNAGFVLRAPAEQHPDEYWDQVIEVNLNAQFVLARELAKPMLERGAGKIIFIASVLTFQGGLTVPGYAASKGGVAQLTKAMANEWASKGVNVNAIAPGYFATDNNTALREDPVRYPAITTRIPAGRWGEPEDLGGAVVFLASRASDYMHGSVLTVDGGWLGR